MKKRILVLLALIMSVLFVSCGSSGDNVKDALNDTSIFSQEEIDYVNSEIEETKQYGYNVTSKTINSTTMQFSGNYSYEDEGKTVSGTFSDKIEKKNGIVYETFTNYLDPDDSYVYYELTIPRVFGVYTNNDYFLSTSKNTLKTLLKNNGFEGFDTTDSWDENNNYFQLEVLLYASQNSKLYNGFIGKMNNKYYF